MRLGTLLAILFAAALLVSPLYAQSLGICPDTPVRSSMDITLDPENKLASVFVFNISKNYNKSPIANALIFRVNMTNLSGINFCYDATSDGSEEQVGWADFPYDPNVSGCMDFWFIFCPQYHGAGGEPTQEDKEMCLGGTSLQPSDITKAMPPCGAGALVPIDYSAKYLPSHNELYICNQVPRDFAPLCWPLMLIFGTLVGASFALGRNPFQAFDFSSPKLSRGKQYTMRVQQVNLDALSAIMAAKTGVGAAGNFADLAEGKINLIDDLKTRLTPEFLRGAPTKEDIKKKEGLRNWDLFKPLEKLGVWVGKTLFGWLVSDSVLNSIAKTFTNNDPNAKVIEDKKGELEVVLIKEKGKQAGQNTMDFAVVGKITKSSWGYEVTGVAGTAYAGNTAKFDGVGNNLPEKGQQTNMAVQGRAGSNTWTDMAAPRTGEGQANTLDTKKIVIAAPAYSQALIKQNPAMVSQMSANPSEMRNPFETNANATQIKKDMEEKGAFGGVFQMWARTLSEMLGKDVNLDGMWRGDSILEKIGSSLLNLMRLFGAVYEINQYTKAFAPFRYKGMLRGVADLGGIGQKKALSFLGRRFTVSEAISFVQNPYSMPYPFGALFAPIVNQGKLAAESLLSGGATWATSADISADGNFMRVEQNNYVIYCEKDAEGIFQTISNEKLREKGEDGKLLVEKINEKIEATPIDQRRIYVLLNDIDGKFSYKQVDEGRYLAELGRLNDYLRMLSSNYAFLAQQYQSAQANLLSDKELEQIKAGELQEDVAVAGKLNQIRAVEQAFGFSAVSSNLERISDMLEGDRKLNATTVKTLEGLAAKRVLLDSDGKPLTVHQLRTHLKSPDGRKQVAGVLRGLVELNNRAGGADRNLYHSMEATITSINMIIETNESIISMHKMNVVDKDNNILKKTVDDLQGQLSGMYADEARRKSPGYKAIADKLYKLREELRESDEKINGYNEKIKTLNNDIDKLQTNMGKLDQNSDEYEEAEKKLFRLRNELREYTYDNTTKAGLWAGEQAAQDRAEHYAFTAAYAKSTFETLEFSAQFSVLGRVLDYARAREIASEEAETARTIGSVQPLGREGLAGLPAQTNLQRADYAVMNMETELRDDIADTEKKLAKLDKNSLEYAKVGERLYALQTTQTYFDAIKSGKEVDLKEDQILVGMNVLNRFMLTNMDHLDKTGQAMYTATNFGINENGSQALLGIAQKTRENALGLSQVDPTDIKSAGRVMDMLAKIGEIDTDSQTKMVAAISNSMGSLQLKTLESTVTLDVKAMKAVNSLRQAASDALELLAGDKPAAAKAIANWLEAQTSEASAFLYEGKDTVAVWKKVGKNLSENVAKNEDYYDYKQILFGGADIKTIDDNQAQLALARGSIALMDSVQKRLERRGEDSMYEGSGYSDAQVSKIADTSRKNLVDYKSALKDIEVIFKSDKPSDKTKAIADITELNRNLGDASYVIVGLEETLYKNSGSYIDNQLYRRKAEWDLQPSYMGSRKADTYYEIVNDPTRPTLVAPEAVLKQVSSTGIGTKSENDFGQYGGFKETGPRILSATETGLLAQDRKRMQDADQENREALGKVKEKRRKINEDDL